MLQQFAAQTVLFVVVCCFSALIFTRKQSDLIFAGGLLFLLLTGATSVKVAFSGFSSPALVTVASLYVVAAAIHHTGAIFGFLKNITANIHRTPYALHKLLMPVAALSAVLNNTPIVAALIPAIKNISKQRGIDASKWLLPISYAAILGGTITIIGTSTNLLVYGLLTSEQDANLGLFEIAKIGIPITLVGVLYLTLFSSRLIPDRKSPEISLADTRQYTLEMIVEDESPLNGKTVAEAGLRNLKGLFLVEVIRDDLTIAAVEPTFRLNAGDRLIFTGMVEAIAELMQIDGLKLAEKQVFKLRQSSARAQLVEAVVSSSNPLVGTSIKNGRFREKYDAAVIAIVRNGERIRAKAGEVVLRSGDALLLLTRGNFVNRYRYSKDFLLVGELGHFETETDNKANWCWLSILTLFVLSATQLTSVTVAALSAASIVVISGCISWSEAKDSLDLQVLLTIGFSLGMGASLMESGAANILAGAILGMFGNSPLTMLIASYLLTMVLTETLTNSAAAVIAYALVSGVVTALGYNPIPFAVAIMIAASSSFISPMGYQTNLMVYSQGGYHATDFLRLGLPLSVLVALVTLWLIPMFWPLV